MAFADRMNKAQGNLAKSVTEQAEPVNAQIDDIAQFLSSLTNRMEHLDDELDSAVTRKDGVAVARIASEVNAVYYQLFPHLIPQAPAEEEPVQDAVADEPKTTPNPADPKAATKPADNKSEDKDADKGHPGLGKRLWTRLTTDGV